MKNEDELKSKLKKLNDQLKDVKGASHKSDSKDKIEKLEMNIHTISRQMSLYKDQELIINEFYDTVGIFCSVGCMLCYFYNIVMKTLYIKILYH